jgi:hypothetical protein
LGIIIDGQEQNFLAKIMNNRHERESGLNIIKIYRHWLCPKENSDSILDL